MRRNAGLHREGTSCAAPQDLSLLDAADIAGQLQACSAEDAERRAHVRPNEERAIDVQITRRVLESARASCDPCCVSIVVA